MVGSPHNCSSQLFAFPKRFLSKLRAPPEWQMLPLVAVHKTFFFLSFVVAFKDDVKKLAISFRPPVILF